MKEIKIDARGDQCPIPVIKTKKALSEVTEPSVVEVSVDNEIAVQNLSKMGKQKKLEYSCEKINEQHYIIKIKTGDLSEEQNASVDEVQDDQGEVCYPNRKTNTEDCKK